MFSKTKTLLLLISCMVALASCTTFAEKKRILDEQFKAINKSDGVDKDEALIIARHYITIKTDLGRLNVLSNEIIDDNEYWLFHLRPHSSAPNDSTPRIRLLVDKSDGIASKAGFAHHRKNEESEILKHNKRFEEISNPYHEHNVDYVEITGYEPVDDESMIKQYEAINKKDGINKDEAMIIARHYIQIESNLNKRNKLSDEVIDDNEHWLIDVIPNRITRSQQNDLKLLIDKSNGLVLRQDIPLGERAEKHKELIRRLEEQYEQLTKRNAQRKQNDR